MTPEKGGENFASTLEEKTRKINQGGNSLMVEKNSKLRRCGNFCGFAVISFLALGTVDERCQEIAGQGFDSRNTSRTFCTILFGHFEL